MSERQDRSGRFGLLQRLLEESLSANPSLKGQMWDELFELLEQLEAEYDELMRGQEETERLHRLYADLYEYAPVGYVVLNAERIIVQANETARRFVGPGAIDLGRSALGARISPETQDNYYEALRRCRERGEPASAEFLVRGDDGRSFWLSARVTCDTEREGRVSGYRIILSDVTERVLAERRAESHRVEVEALLKEKELLLRETHHRVKNDFGMVSSFLALQAADSDNAAVRAGMKDAQSRVHTMGRIYDALHRQEQYATVDLKPLVEQIVSAFDFGQTGETPPVSIDVEELTAPTSIGVGLGLVLNELLTNATKYAAERSLDLKIAVSLHSSEEGVLELQVADSGPGLPESVRTGGSPGFGFTVVRALAEQHEGSVTMENRGGAVVTVRMRVPEEPPESLPR